MKRALFLALIAVATVPSSAAAKRRPCTLSGSTTILATKSSRLFTRHAHVYACSNARNKRFLLASGASVSLPALTSSYAAVALARSVEAINLTTGAILRFHGAATDLVLAGDGSLAWIATHEVHRYNVGDKADTVVDSGQDIQPHSLALAGKTLYWMKGTQPFTASLR